jgi:hypothetical protein
MIHWLSEKRIEGLEEEMKEEMKEGAREAQAFRQLSRLLLYKGADRLVRDRPGGPDKSTTQYPG